MIRADLISFAVAFCVLLLLIRIPENKKKADGKRNVFSGCANGFLFLFERRGLWYIVLTMAVINFFSRLTYENILSPMILARCGGDSCVLGTVNALMGAGGILGGIIVSARKRKWNAVKMIYLPAALSFLLGDTLMGLGRNAFWWSVAGIAASFPIPFIMAGQRVILYRLIPRDMQGSVFSARNAIQYSTIPVGILLGGSLADCVFEPFMRSDFFLANALRHAVGGGDGGGMAVMFLCTGTLGFVSSILAYRKKEIRALARCEDDG